jgi:hypothetical protein
LLQDKNTKNELKSAHIGKKKEKRKADHPSIHPSFVVSSSI